MDYRAAFMELCAADKGQNERNSFAESGAADRNGKHGGKQVHKDSKYLHKINARNIDFDRRSSSGNACTRFTDCR